MCIAAWSQKSLLEMDRWQYLDHRSLDQWQVFSFTGDYNGLYYRWNIYSFFCSPPSSRKRWSMVYQSD